MKHLANNLRVVSIYVVCLAIVACGRDDAELQIQVFQDVLEDVLMINYVSNPVDFGFWYAAPDGLWSMTEDERRAVADSAWQQHIAAYERYEFIAVIEDPLSNFIDFAQRQPSLIWANEPHADKDRAFRAIDTLYARYFERCSSSESHTLDVARLGKGERYRYESTNYPVAPNQWRVSVQLSAVCFNDARDEGVFAARVLNENKSGFNTLAWVLYRPELDRWILADLTYAR